MKKIVLKNKEEEIFLSEVNTNRCIFAKKDGELAGMVLKEKAGWVLRTGPIVHEGGRIGHRDTLKECIESGMAFGFIFYT